MMDDEEGASSATKLEELSLSRMARKFQNACIFATSFVFLLHIEKSDGC